MKSVKRGVTFALVISGLLVLLVGPALAQVTNQQVVNLIDFNHVGTRAQALGGAFVAVADDETAAYWNPAGVSGITKDTIPLAASVTVVGNNVPSLQQIGQLGTAIQDAQAFVTVIIGADAPLQQRIDAANQLLDLINRVPGVAPDIKANAFFGANALNVGVFANVRAAGRFALSSPVAGTARLDGGLAGLGEAGVAYSHSSGEHFHWGVAIKGMGGAVGTGFITADTTGAINSTLPDVTQSLSNPVLAADIGMIKEMSEHSRFGAVIRNANAPDPYGVNASAFRPQVDIGWAEHGDHGVFAIDVHNLTTVNGRPSTFHIGAERKIFDVAYLRAGLNAGQPAFGFGLRALTLHLDLAAGLDAPAGGFVTFALASRF